ITKIDQREIQIVSETHISTTDDSFCWPSENENVVEKIENILFCFSTGSFGEESFSNESSGRTRKFQLFGFFTRQFACNHQNSGNGFCFSLFLVDESCYVMDFGCSLLEIVIIRMLLPCVLDKIVE